jgi:hypothetical protein
VWTLCQRGDGGKPIYCSLFGIVKLINLTPTGIPGGAQHAPMRSLCLYVTVGMSGGPLLLKRQIVLYDIMSSVEHFCSRHFSAFMPIDNKWTDSYLRSMEPPFSCIFLWNLVKHLRGVCAAPAARVIGYIMTAGPWRSGVPSPTWAIPISKKAYPRRH